MRRAFILLLDSFGIGALPDADEFNDLGANTLRHIAQACLDGDKSQRRSKRGSLKLPNLTRLGLNALVTECNGSPAPGLNAKVIPQAKYGYAAELSCGKDTTSGHWEIAGVPVCKPWGMFQKEYPSFPEELIDNFIRQTKVLGVLGNKAASGTEIICELGGEHVRTGEPIVYTSADSVFQIATHEESFGLQRLYEICEIGRKLVDKYNVARVIARPFIGKSGSYKRTGNRKDYSVAPPKQTLLDKLVETGGEVVSVGKISDIFAHQGITKKVKAIGNMDLFDKTLEEIKLAGDRTLIFANFIDFDMEYGHRRDVFGYANALEEFDKRIPELEKLLQPGDIAIITADHGCDPTYTGTDHTREYIPILVFGSGIKPGSIGKRETFADIGQSLADYFELPFFNTGKSFL